ncbi:MAG: right-handed parallel beta-helix repeat-containing protein [Methanomassiliicoccales archaeon]|nr:right-handed parallel beta-helix repeat-containing protein [Methanomassiliicoccales archaeon]
MMMSKTLALAMALSMLIIGLVPICTDASSIDSDRYIEKTIDDRIDINGTADFHAQADHKNWAGTGTKANPYIISGLVIECDANQTAINIMNTDAYFSIRDCSMTAISQDNIDKGSSSSGVELVNVTNGRLSDLAINGFVYGITIFSCGNIIVDNSSMSDAAYNGLEARYSNDIVFENNSVTRCDAGGVDANNCDGLLIQGNNVSFNSNYGFNLWMSITDSLIRWNLASRNGWYSGHAALFIAGTGNTIYGNILVSPGGPNSMPAEYGSGADNKWNSSNGVGNFYGKNYNLWPGKYTSFLGDPICSTLDENGDGISDVSYKPKNGGSSYEGENEVDHYPLISPTSAPRNLSATVDSNQITLSWDDPFYMTGCIDHYMIVRNDGVSTTRINVTGASYIDTIGNVDEWTSISYSVVWASKFMTSGPSNIAVGQNPDCPSVSIISELGIKVQAVNDVITYSNSTVDPQDVLVQWSGFDSDSTTMVYQVRMDDGDWVDKGQATNHTFTNLSQGNHTVTVKATDNDNNLAECSKTFVVRKHVQMSVSCFPVVDGDNYDLMLKGKAWDLVTGDAIPALDISIAYSIERGQSWNFQAVSTGTDGSFQVTIDLDLKAIMAIMLSTCLVDQYSDSCYYYENVTYAALTLEGRDGVFLTKSTSTISDFLFSSNMLKFNVTGENGTSGSTSIYIPKAEMSEVEGIEVLLDGAESTYSIESTEDYWILTVNYSHSMHQITVNMEPTAALGDSSTVLMMVLVIVIAAVVIGIVLIRRRRKA